MALENSIWNSLSVLRGNLELNQFRNVVLTTLYLKNVTPDSYASLLDNGSADIYRTFLRLIIKTENTDTLKVIVTDLDIEVLSFEDSVFKEVLYLINQVEKEIPVYNEAFDFLINIFSKSAGKAGQVNITPKSISSIFKLIVGDANSVTDPACGTGGLLAEFITDKGVKIIGQDRNREAIAISKLRFAFKASANFVIGDSLEDTSLVNIKSDAVIINPPFNLSYEASASDVYKYGLPPKNNANFLWLQKGLSLVNDDGVFAVVLSNSALSIQGSEGEIRRKMIEDGLVEAIISLPSNLLDYTSIPVSIWVLRPNRINKESILFINGSDLGQMTSRSLRELSTFEVDNIGEVYKDYSEKGHVSLKENSDLFRIVDIQKVEENDFIISTNRYFYDDLDETIENAQKLDSLVSTPRNIAIEENANIIKRLSIKDLVSSVDKFEIEINELIDDDRQSTRSALKGGVLLLAKVGEKLKPSFLPKCDDKIMFTLINIFPFIIDESKVRVDYLIQELNKDYVIKQINKYREGSAIQSIRIGDILSIKISVPTLDKQKEKVAKEKEVRFHQMAKIHGFEKEIAFLKEQQRKDLGSKKHNILQYLNNVKASSDILIKILERNNGVLNAGDIINPKTGVTVEKRLNRLQESVNSVLFYVNNLTNDIDFDKTESINIHDFLKDCVEKGFQSEIFDIRDNSDKETFKEVEPIVEVSKRNFEELYNNVLENAYKHGFVDSNLKYIFQYSVSIEKNQVIVLFENNGKPFPKGMGNKERYIVRGEKAGITANTGEGSWKISQIADYFGAQLEIFDEPEDEFPVGIKLTFKLEQ